MILPVVVLVLTALPLVVRHVRAAMDGVLDAPFCERLGVTESGGYRLLYRYALPAAANPLISLFGFSIGALLSSSLLVEVIMSWPGMGPLLVEAILARDLYVVIGGVLLSTLFLVAGNFGADLLLYWGRSEDPHRAGSKMIKRRQLAKWLAVLVALHGVIACAGFFAPYDPVAQDRQHPYAPPSKLHFLDKQGRVHMRPFPLPAPHARGLVQSV